MILEVGRIVTVEAEGLWVETIQRRVCGSCQAQKGCGQSLLAKFGESASRLWVLLDGRDAENYHVGDEVSIGIPEDVITLSALFIYMAPLFGLLTATTLAHYQSLSDSVSVVWALVGLLLGGCAVRWHAYHSRFNTHLQPVLVEDHQTELSLVEVK